MIEERSEIDWLFGAGCTVGLGVLCEGILCG